MPTDNSNFLTNVYRERIREPRTADEVWGYWLFVLGILVGLVGLFLVIGSEVASTRRGLAVAILGLSLLTLLLGSVVRLELREPANKVAALGALVGLLAIGWFWLVYPENWQFGTSQVWNVLGLGSAGIALMVIAAVIVPLVTDPQAAEHEAELAAERAAREEAAAEAASASEGMADAEAALAAVQASQTQFELYEDSAGEYRWRLRHRNTNVIADGGEGYSSRQKAQQGLLSVKRNAHGSPVVDLEPVAPAIDDADDATDGPDAPPMLTESETQSTFETYEDAEGKHRWRLRHDNGEIVADSGQGYASRSGVTEAVTRARASIPAAAYLRVDPVAFEMYEDAAGEWRWRLIHENGNFLADGGEGYSGRTRCRQGAESVASNVGPDGDAEFEVYQNNRGDYSWRLLHDNGNVIADSGEGYATESGAEDAVDRVREYAPKADLVDVGDAAFEIYEDAAEEWRWRLRHRNGNVLADSGGGYRGRSEASTAITRVKRHAPNAAEETVVE